jgi:tRNA(fMet)-specific endonuclease VapC
MNGKFLLDTNIVIRLLALDPVVQQRLGENADVVVSTFVLGELYYGAHRSSRVRENVEAVGDLIGEVEVLSGDIRTAYTFGEIKNELRLKGRMIPVSDLWIAALARQHDLTLVSRDRHFAEVEGLRWEQW